MRVSRLMCFVGNHHWETVTDAGGALTACTRCGKIRHDYAPSSPRRTAGVAEQQHLAGMPVAVTSVAVDESDQCPAPRRWRINLNPAAVWPIQRSRPSS
jgi:hypothetical protein